MKKTIVLLLSIIFISCENEIVEEMQNFNGVWALKSSEKATLLENAGITSIDFGNGFFSRKSSRSENVGKGCFYVKYNERKEIPSNI